MAKKIKAKSFALYLKARTEFGFEKYCGHHKVIRYADGLPIYSIMLPPLCSEAYAHYEVITDISARQNRPLPFLVSVALTDKCNIRCEHCSFYTSVDDPNKKVLSVDELKDAIVQSQNLGASVINFVGGEPLMHPQWREVFASVDKRRSHVFLFTNGWFLAESANDIKAAGVGGVYASIDASTAEAHDKKRGKPGLFKKAIEGIAAAKKAGLTVGISCCIDKEEFESGELDNIIEMGRREGVHEVLVFDATPVGMYSSREDLWGNQEWLERMIAHVKKYNQDEKYPGVLLYSYLSSYLGMGCAGGTIYYYITPYGDICPCDFYHKTFGNVREEKLAHIWDRMSQQLGAHGSSWTGCRAKQKHD